MAKSKEFEKKYKEEGKRRMLIRKKERGLKYVEKAIKNSQPGCKICEEYPYCYCGDGTPYSY